MFTIIIQLGAEGGAEGEEGRGGAGEDGRIKGKIEMAGSYEKKG